MDIRRFDNLILALPQRAGSRRMVTAFLAGLGLLLVPTPDAEAKRNKRKKKRKKAKSADAGALLLEELAAQMQAVSGNCDALTQAAEQFRQAHLAEMTELANTEQQLDAGTRSQAATKHQERITQATETLHTLMAACRYRGASESAICDPPGPDLGGDQGPLPGAPQCGAGCDCSCICPISGWTCTFNFFGCLGGSHASCCWFGACAGNMCLEQCPNCCNCGLDCCGC